MATHLKNLSDFSSTAIPSAQNYRFGIVVSEWNSPITSALLQGAIKVLEDQGCEEENIQIIQVPGSYELISGSQLLAEAKKFDAIIALGCVIQGETRHFDFICSAVAQGIANVGIKYRIPVIFGVLTTDNLEQAKDRSGGKHGNKGDEAAVTAIKMADLAKNL